MTQIGDLHRRWRKDADYKDAYDALGEEFRPRAIADRSQDGGGSLAVATYQDDEDFASDIARIEGGKVRPSADALERFAQATRTRLRIVFEPEPAR